MWGGDESWAGLVTAPRRSLSEPGPRTLEITETKGFSRMRTARSAERRWTAPLAVVLLGLTVAITIVLLAGRAWAAEGTPAPSAAAAAPAAEVCAPGAMTITREGPVVYDGVDCDL